LLSLFIDKVQEQQKREKSKGEIEAKQTKKKTAKKGKQQMCTALVVVCESTGMSVSVCVCRNCANALTTAQGDDANCSRLQSQSQPASQPASPPVRQ